MAISLSLGFQPVCPQGECASLPKGAYGTLFDSRLLLKRHFCSSSGIEFETCRFLRSSSYLVLVNTERPQVRIVEHLGGFDVDG